MLGTVNATYFATNAFIPDYLRSNGEAEWTSAALSALNIGQIPASLILLAVAGRLGPVLAHPISSRISVRAAMVARSVSCSASSSIREYFVSRRSGISRM